MSSIIAQSSPSEAHVRAAQSHLNDRGIQLERLGSSVKKRPWSSDCGLSFHLSITLTKTDYEDGEPYRWYYDLNTTVEFKDGYIAPFHEGPDPLPTPEPTSGFLLLAGAALLALRRRAANAGRNMKAATHGLHAPPQSP